jgi:hypothetical protein
MPKPIKKRVIIDIELGSEFQLHHYDMLKSIISSFEGIFHNPTMPCFRHKMNSLSISYFDNLLPEEDGKA